MKVRVPVVTPKEMCTHIELCVDYWKGDGIIAHAYPVKIDGNGLMSCNVSSLIGGTTVLEPITRANRKKLEVWGARMDADVRGRMGTGWKLVEQRAEREGVTLAPAV